MANTAFATTDALTQKIWSAILLKEALREIYLSKFMGESTDNIIQVKNELTKQKGDKITIPLRMQMTSPGQSSQTVITLETNEEALIYYNYAVELWLYGHAVRADDKLSLQRPAFDLRTDMKDALKDWLANKIEVLLATALATSPEATHYINKTVSPTSTLTVALIQAAKRKAQLANPKVRPINIEGGEYYVMLVHPYGTKGLKADSDWKNAQLYANIRGKDNPIFNGALGIIDGVVLHEYDRSQLIVTAGKTRCLLLGAQAGALVWGQQPQWHEKLFDYERIPGVAVDLMAGVGKCVFNALDFGVITLDVTYVAD